MSVVLGVGTAAAVRDSRIVSKVHSGSPGFKKSSTGKLLHWAKGGVTVYVDDSLTKLGPAANEAAMQAFGSWVASNELMPNVSFDTVAGSAAPRQDGKSVVSYSKITVPGHEHDVAITLTYSDDKTGEILEADVVVNALYPEAVLTAADATAPQVGTSSSGQGDGKGGSDKNAVQSRKSTHQYESLDCRDRYDLQNVVTHEVGHFFGLGEDMSDTNATMFYSIDECETHKRLPKADDIQTMSQLYNETADPEEVKAAGVRGCSVAGPAKTGFESLWLALWAAVPLLRRRRHR